MVSKSKGFKRGTRQKLKLKKKPTLTRFLQEFRVGESVHIDIQPSVAGFPHHRFHGATGKIIGKRGSAYVIEVRDKNKLKKIITKPVHLKKA